MPAALSLQNIIQSLHAFWAGHGCTIWHPHGEKVGAGTMNPATFLRVLGPEPWRVGYVEPSFRADDGRYAENPNRMQMHTQYQVILKPDPGCPQELYLASLSALGLDRTVHDIRFVEDNWESPALSAWGLGWEVWLDGQEITQFTYFQQAGGLVLDPVSVEITYGLERIAMFLQGHREVWSIDVDGRHTYADLHRPHEVAHSRYNFDTASVARLQTLNRLYQEEAEECLAHGLYHLAHDYLLRQSHTFNLLDARGAVGVTERAQYFRVMRQQARTVAQQYAEERQRLEYPFLPDREASPADARPSSPAAPVPAAHPPGGTDTLLVEIGMEELPAHEVPRGIAQLQEQMPRLLAQFRLAHGPVQVSGTVRRFVIRVEALALQQADEVQERRGPSVQVAYHADGMPSRAALGFARSSGVAVDKLETRGKYVFAVTRQKGQPTDAMLPEVLAQLLDSLHWTRAMRWNSSGKAFPRPLRWLMVLLGDAPVPFTWADVQARNATRLPRYQEALRDDGRTEPVWQTISSCPAYGQWAAAQGIILDRGRRQAEIQRQVTEVARSLGGVIREDAGLLEEVTDLVEAPLALAGSIPAEYLELPVPVLITVMRKHQRYFPVCAADSPETLLPHFITIVNGVSLQDADTVRTGNESVLNARFADAAFFIGRDLATSAADLAPRLDSLVFHARLGTMQDKVQRLVRLTPLVGQQLDLEAREQQASVQAAALCKHDLVMQMVVEMTSLQGIMGELHARAAGVDEAACAAIREHHQPRAADDDVPVTRPGLALGVADRLDSLVGLMAAGIRPRGNADPFGLRRLALGLVRSLLHHRAAFSLRTGLAAAAAQYPFDITQAVQEQVLDFLWRRVRVIMLEEGLPHDVVAAVAACPQDDPVHRRQLAHDLAAMAPQPAWKAMLEAYSRCVRILPADHVWDRQAQPHWELPLERELHACVQEALLRLDRDVPTVARFVHAMEPLTPLVGQFFDDAMVLADDPDLRRSRLGLMAAVRRLGTPLGDLTQLRV